MSRVVQIRRARQTGTVVQVIDNRDGSFLDDALDWITYCEEHTTLCEHETRKVAESWAADPEGWCEECRGTEAVEHP